MTGTGMDPNHYDQTHPRRRARKFAEPAPAENLFDHVPKVSDSSALLQKLVAIANELLIAHTGSHGRLYGITIGEVVLEAEARGIVVQAPEMEDKGKQQRATSGLLPRVLPRCGLVRTADYRPSPVKRHHGTPHRVYVRREVKP